MKARKIELDGIYMAATNKFSTAQVACDGSVPKANNLAATAAYTLQRGRTRPIVRTMVAGKATSTDAELLAIWSGIVKAIGQDLVSKIIVYLDSVSAIRLATDPSLHSEQSHSIVICSKLRAWLLLNPENKIYFIHVPSSLRWREHEHAHKEATKLLVEATANSRVYLDYACKRAVTQMLDSW